MGEKTEQRQRLAGPERGAGGFDGGDRDAKSDRMK